MILVPLCSRSCWLGCPMAQSLVAWPEQASVKISPDLQNRRFRRSKMDTKCTFQHIFKAYFSKAIFWSTNFRFSWYKQFRTLKNSKSPQENHRKKIINFVKNRSKSYQNRIWKRVGFEVGFFFYFWWVLVPKQDSKTRLKASKIKVHPTWIQVVPLRAKQVSERFQEIPILYKRGSKSHQAAMYLFSILQFAIQFFIQAKL